MMRFKRGDKVEVLTLKEGPSGSWRCAEIIGSNRHHYTVSYEGGVELLGKATIEKVSRKAVRPCPPEVDVLQDWVPDDVVEVFHNISWMMATIVKVLECSHFLVRLLGLGVDIEADKYDIRPRLCWQDGEWIVIGKASNKCEGMRFRIPSSRNDTKQPRKMIAKVNGHAKGDNRFTKNSNIVLGSEAMPLKTVKRKLSIVHSQVEAYARPNKKKITFRNRESLLNQFNAMEQCQSPEKGHIQRGLCTLALMLRDALICHLMSCAHSCTNFIVFETCHELLNSLLCVWLLHASIRGHVGALKPKSCVFHKNFCGTVACNKAPTPQTC